jgi:hypothetical protein
MIILILSDLEHVQQTIVTTKGEFFFQCWLTVHFELYYIILYNKPTRCTNYLHVIEVPRLYMFRAHL